MKKIIFILLILKSGFLFAAYPFDNFSNLYTQQPTVFSTGPYHTYLLKMEQQH